MDVNLESSIVGLTIQLIGIVLVTVLSFLLTRSIRRRFLDYWFLSWLCLSFSLTALLAAFCLPVPAKLFYSLYFFGEYAFGILFIAGCRHYVTGAGLGRRQRWLFAAALVALLLPHISDDFSLPLACHTSLFVIMWVRAFYVLRPARCSNQAGFGVRVVSVALFLLAVDFFQYLPAGLHGHFTGYKLALTYLKYSSLYDLILEILLGFGTVMVVMESIRRELEKANHDLKITGARLQILAEKDPLTDALNRHAFYSLVDKCASPTVLGLRGCVSVIDIDDFKIINDTFGHATGDAAIRAVAGGLRAIIRADDLLFRWGGDEFLIILVGLNEKETRRRLDQFPANLKRLHVSGLQEPLTIDVSFGIADFGGSTALEKAIDLADREMYSQKQARKAAARRPESAYHLTEV